MLAELKCSGARCHDIQANLSKAAKLLNLACEQLYKQARYLFQMYPHQESVILVAISGFWWSYMVFPRTASQELDLSEDDEMEEEEELDTELSHQTGIHDILEDNPWDSNEMSIQDLKEQLYDFPLGALQDTVVPTARVHKVLSPLHENGWSDFLLFGTAPSNQVLSLILERLHSVVHVKYDGRMG